MTLKMAIGMIMKHWTFLFQRGHCYKKNYLSYSLHSSIVASTELLAVMGSSSELYNLWYTVIELYIGTRGRSGNATCTSVTGPQGDNAPFCTRATLNTKYAVCLLMQSIKKWAAVFKLFRGVYLIRFNRGWTHYMYAMIYCPKWRNIIINY